MTFLPLRRFSIIGIILFALLLPACGTTPTPTPPASTMLVAAPPQTLTQTPSHATASALHTTEQLPAPAPGTVVPAATAPATHDLAAIAQRNHIPILCYHAIRQWTLADVVANRPYIVPTNIFAMQMELLAKESYHTITPDQLLAYLTKGTVLPAKPVLLTFDDSDGTQWTNALPVLRAHHFTATFFIMTIVLDKPGYLTSAQVQELDQLGMTIGAHTWNHARVTRYTGTDWDQQITEPTAQLARLVNHPINYFAYPYGLWNDDAVQHIQQAHFVAAFQLGERASATAPLFTIRRIIANPLWTPDKMQHALAQDF